ncbi:hypothetical protein J437_LFUL009458 [Ladona fulva]|uniref:Uncharacterized protein n=1 Tax=Ladona fulva TaxID=123851 RepID=A0A8K0K746_LADFU|nr:hypothetical protein J437_LFUL009458 [Ladona fulva]
MLAAFLEMADESAASSMVTYFTNCVAQLRGRAVYVQFSNHRELKTDQTHSNAVSPNAHSALPPLMVQGAEGQEGGQPKPESEAAGPSEAEDAEDNVIGGRLPWNCRAACSLPPNTQSPAPSAAPLTTSPRPRE